MDKQHRSSLYVWALLLWAVSALSSGALWAADPLCKTNVSANLTLTRDIDCTGETGNMLTVTADNVTIDGGGHTIVATSADSAVRVAGYTGVTIKNLTIQGYSMGVRFDGGGNATVQNITVSTNTTYGIYFNGVSGAAVSGITSPARSYGFLAENLTENVTISNSNFSSSSGAYGVYFTNGRNITLDGVTASSRQYGLLLIGQTFVVKNTNALSNTTTGLYFSGSGLSVTSTSVAGSVNGIQLSAVSGSVNIASSTNFSSTTISLRLAGVAGVTFDGLTLPGTTYGIYSDGNLSQNLTIKNCNASATTGSGLWLENLKTSTIENVTATGRSYGAYARSSGLTVKGSDFSGNGQYGLYLVGDTLTVENNKLKSGGTGLMLASVSKPVTVAASNDFSGNAFGIRLSNVDTLTLDGVTISGATSYGLYGDGTNKSITLKNSTITGNGSYGFYLTNATGTLIESSKITGFTSYGVRLGGSGHTIKGCDLKGNTGSVYLSGTSISVTNNQLGGGTYGVVLESASAPIDIATSNTFTSTITSIHLSAVSGLTLDGLTLPGSSYGVYSDGNLSKNLELTDLNLTGNGGYGIYLANTQDVLVDAVDTTGRAYGIYAGGTRVTIQDSTLVSNSSRAIHLAGTDHEVTGNDLTGSGTGILLQNVVAPMVITNDNNFTRTTIGIYLSYVEDLELTDLVLASTSYGIYGDGGLNRGIVITDTDVSGASGYGIYLANAEDAHLDGVTATGRAEGIRVTGTGTVIENCIARNTANRGLFVTGSDITLNGNDTQGANTGILLANVSAPFTLSSDHVFTGTSIGIYLSSTDGLELTDLALPSSSYSIYSDGNLTQNLTLSDLAASATGGQGVYLENVGTVTVDGVVARGRSTALYANGKNVTVKNCDFQNSSSRAVFFRGTSATLQNTNLAGSATGLLLQTYQAPLTLATNNNFSGTNFGIYLSGVSGLTFDGYTLNSASYAIYGDGNLSQNLTFKNLVLSATGGQGIYLEKADNVTVDAVTAKGRVTGVYTTGTGNTIKNCDLSSSSGRAVYLRGSGHTVSGNNLSFSNVGILLESIQGSLNLAGGNVLTGTSIGLYLSTVSDVTISDLALPSSSYGIYSDGNLSQNLTFNNISVAGTGGTGLQLSNVKNVTFNGLTASGRNTGVYLSGNTMTINDGKITGNVGGVRILGSRATIATSAFCGNTAYGLQDETSDGVVATGNYWGSPTGPTSTGNPGGKGDKVTGKAIFYPFDTGSDEVFAIPECAVAINCFVDADGDGVGSYTVDPDSDGDCTDEGQSPVNGDCDDTNPDVYYNAPELDDGIDNDCDGTVDEGTASYDNDDDGFTGDDGDCDDNNANVYPGATETCGDGVDSDCSGADLSCNDVDNDGDGYTENQGDCNDAKGNINPGATEICGNGLDDDCKAGDLSCSDFDNDGDGYTENEGDCDDALAAVNPSRSEICGNGLDDDCSGGDADCDDLDNDGDGYTENEGDCDDAHNTAYPGGTETCGNGIDEDCSGADLSCNDVDNDGDGYTENQGDCKDNAAGVNPGAAEVCSNNVDEDCSGSDLSCNDVDNDGDGYTENQGDCADTDAAINPDASEVCNNKDDDCDGPRDEGAVDAPSWYVDLDGDGYGTPDSSVKSCKRPTGYSAYGDDCNDEDADINPSSPEVCDTVDQDCDGQIDEGVQRTYYADTDKDTYGDPNNVLKACSQPSGSTTNRTDCDDTSASVHPGATDPCGDGVDQNCDGYDLSCDSTDDDGDGASEVDGDCNDADPNVGPGEEDTPYDGIDQDCEGGDLVDVDGDGSSGAPVDGGSPEDCDDSDADVNPSAEEVCDGADNNCDGQTDDVDADGDGVVAPGCAAEGEPDDCDDNDPRVGDFLEEEDGLDNDCDGQIDEDTPASDDDGDGVSENDGDCDDADANTWPGAEEIPFSGVDEDCDGDIDENNPDITPTPEPTQTPGEDTPTEAPTDEPATPGPTEGVTDTPATPGPTEGATETPATPDPTEGVTESPATPGATEAPTAPIDPTGTPETPTAPEEESPTVDDVVPTEEVTSPPGVTATGGGCNCDQQDARSALPQALLLLGVLALRRRRQP